MTDIKFVDLIQGSDEWKEFRKFKIGSSLAASIMGVGFKTPLQLFDDIMEDRETPDNEAMRRGREMEPIAREWVNRKYGINLQPAVIEHPKADWHISSLDGIYLEEGKEPFVVEIKHPGKIDHEKALNGEVPEKYIPQCLHILEGLPGVSKMLYVSYKNEDSVAEIWVYRDEHKMADQFAEELSFYSKLLSCRPPTPSDKDWIEIVDLEAMDLVEEYVTFKRSIEQMKAKSEKLKEEIVSRMGSLSRGKMGGVKIQKITKQSAPDYSKIPELQGVDLDKYRGDPIIFWKIGN